MKTLITIFICICSLSIWSQEILAPTNPEMYMMGYTDGNSIKLRWVVLQENMWQDALNNGFKLIRRVVQSNGKNLTYEQQVESQVTLAENYKTNSEAEWMDLFPNNEYASVARQLIYSDEFEIEITADPTLADVIEQSKKSENQLTFSLLIANNDFDVAKAMALGYEDYSAETNKVYEYRITVNSSGNHENFANASTVMGLDHIIELPPIDGLTGVGQNGRSVISWETAGMENYYTSYNIERSEDGTNFETCNDQPYIWTGQEGYEDTRVFYLDSLTNNNTLYSYRIRACTPFGVLSPPSEEIQLKGVEPPMDLALEINGTTVEEDQIILSWANLDESFNPAIEHFDMLRSADVYGPYEKINRTDISSSERYFTDSEAKLNAYYRIQAKDINGHEYQSNPVLVQLIDKDPPAIPIGLSGFVTEAGKMIIKWDENEEEDILGYRVISSVSATGDYIQLTSSELSENKFEYMLDPNIPLDSIYIKVISVDLRKNSSAPSEVLALSRPDITPPAIPNLYKAAPTPEGVKLAWNLSESEDIVRHELQRKPKNAPGWKILLTIPAGQEESQFTDVKTERREFSYRLVAIDYRQNQASSDVIDIKPYDSGIRGEIENFKIFSFKESENGQSTYGIKLSWKYPLDHMLLDFQVYRSKKGSDMRLYKTVPLEYSLNEGPGLSSVIVNAEVTSKPEYWKWTEDGLKDRGKYIYQVIARYKDGSGSAMSRAVTLKL